MCLYCVSVFLVHHSHLISRADSPIGPMQTWQAKTVGDPIIGLVVTRPIGSLLIKGVHCCSVAWVGLARVAGEVCVMRNGTER